MRRILIACVLVACAAGIPPSAFAQGKGSITGVVRDATGGVLPGTSVSVANPATNERFDVFTDRGGKYAVPGLPTGRYEMTVSLEGFAAKKETVEVAGAAVVKDFVLDTGRLSEAVTVTAQKREEQLLDVPMAVTAVTSRAIEAAGATTLKDIAATVPGLSNATYGPGQSRPQVRGISSLYGTPTIGMYMDEVPVQPDAAGISPDLRLLDLERVEVLRGPQGTLYGEASMGGTIRYLTRSPNLGAPSVSLSGDTMSLGDGSPTSRVSAIVNLPVVKDKLGIRAVAGLEKTGGFVDYPALGKEDANGGQTTTVRVKGLWTPTSRLSAQALYDYDDSDYDSNNWAEPDRTVPGKVLNASRNTNHITNFVLNYGFRSFSLLTSTGYFRRKAESTFDLSDYYAPYWPLFGLPAGLVQTVALSTPKPATYEAFTEEIRASSNSAKPLQWTLGFYFRDYKDSSESKAVVTPNVFPFDVLAATSANKSRQYAFFGEAKYVFSPKIDLTLGLRQFGDTRRQEDTSTTAFGVTVTEPDKEATFNSTTPRLVLSVRPDDGRLLYVSASKGFRSGGFNMIASRPTGCPIAADFEPERLWTYETGASASLANDRLTLQGAVYRNEWSDIQTLTTCLGNLFTATDNVGSAVGTGVDVQISGRPAKFLLLSLAANYNDSHYTADSASHRSGDPIDLVPKYTVAVSGDWDFHWTAKTPGRLHVDYQVVDESSISIRTYTVGGAVPFGYTDVIPLLNARVSASRGPVEFTLFGQNLTDETRVVFPAIGVALYPTINTPRTIGMGVKFDF